MTDNFIDQLLKDLKVGWFLAVRELKRSNIWSTALIVFVMSLTFFNMILMGGILIGLAEGMMSSFKTYYSSDIIIKPDSKKASIIEDSALQSVLISLPTYRASSDRYLSAIVAENEDKIKERSTDIGERVSSTLVGINPENEDSVTGLSNKIVEGNYLTDSDVNSVVLGKSLLSKYSQGSSTEPRLKEVGIGSKLKLIAGINTMNVIVKGVVDTGNSTVDGRIFIPESAMRSFMNNNNLSPNELAISLKNNSSSVDAKNYILANFSYRDDISVERAEETLPKAVFDMKNTFSMLGNIVGAISLIVGAVTIFIVIFVNAITRRKYIGIMKGIGISARAIQVSYMLQSLFYAISGIMISSFIIIWFLKPWFSLHPIHFPVTEGELAVTTTGLLIRAIILTMTAFISGFIPAWLVTKQHTLDAILGR